MIKEDLLEQFCFVGVIKCRFQIILVVLGIA